MQRTCHRTTAVGTPCRSRARPRVRSNCGIYAGNSTTDGYRTQRSMDTPDPQGNRIPYADLSDGVKSGGWV